MNDQTDSFAEALRELDPENLSLFSLLAHTLQRKDLALNAALEAYGRLPRREGSAECDVDIDLVARIKAVCSAPEALAWGQSLAFCVSRRDTRKAAALQDLMRRRAAS